MRRWSVLIYMLDQNNKEIPAVILDKVTYTLHPTFTNPVRVLRQTPFKVEEEGWGEFDIPISIHIVGISGKSGERKFKHDLNFLQKRYVIDHVITIPSSCLKNPTLNKLLTESGGLVTTLSDDSNTTSNGGGLNANKRKINETTGSVFAEANKTKKTKQNSGNAIKDSIDLEKLANGLTKLNEDDLIIIVQMVTDNRTNEMNIKNDVDNGEFTMDLYTFPESLLKSLWDYVKRHTNSP